MTSVTADFDDGTIPSWFNSVQGATVGPDYAHDGVNGVRLAPSPSPGIASLTSSANFPKGHPWVSFSLWFRLVTAPDPSDTYMNLFEIGNALTVAPKGQFTVYFNAGQLWMDFNTEDAHPLGLTPAVGDWHHIECRVYFGDSAYTSQVRIDGGIPRSFIGANNKTATTADVLWIHYPDVNVDYTVDVDSILLTTDDVDPGWITGTPGITPGTYYWNGLELVPATLKQWTGTSLLTASSVSRKQATISVAHIGDSLTFQGGFGQADMVSRYVTSGALAAKVSGRTGRFVYNAADTRSTPVVLDSWAAAGFSPTQLVVALGTNDVLNSDSSFWLGALNSLRAKINSALPRVQQIWWVNLCAAPLSASGADGVIGTHSNTVASYNSFLTSNLNGTTEKILNWNSFAKANVVSSSYWNPDGIHMTTAGYAKRNLWLQGQLAPILAVNSATVPHTFPFHFPFTL